MKIRNCIFLAMTLVFTVLAIYANNIDSMRIFVYATLAAASLSLTVISGSVGYLYEREHQWFTITDWFVKTVSVMTLVSIIIVICGRLFGSLELFSLAFCFFIAVIPTEAVIIILALPIRFILKKIAEKNGRSESSGKP